ncbi:hypothetical protein ACFLWO_01780 [Chloroflexota bacterium]
MNTGKILNESDAVQFLHGVHLRVDESVVCKVLNVLRGKDDTSLYELHSKKPRRDGTPRTSICGKGTIDKISTLFKSGKLKPYLQYLDEASKPQYRPSLQQKDHIKSLNQMARYAMDHIPCLPDFQNEPEAFDPFNDTVVKIYRYLTGDVDWKGMREHLGDRGDEIEKMSYLVDDVLPGWHSHRPNLDRYYEILEQAWFLIKTGGLKTIAEYSETRKWEWDGLNQRCHNCPDQDYEPIK